MSINISEIEQSLIIVYQKNLEFLKKNFFDIYERVEQLSNDISNNKIEENYSLELKDTYFDIQNLKNNGYYYAKNSYIDAEERVKYVNTSLNNSIDLLRKDRITQKLSMPYDLDEVLPVVDFINNKVDFNNIKFQRVMKYVYIGVGLGYHIQEIDKKINSYTTLIVEPELEIFRLSLFTMDYTTFEVGNRTLFLYVGDVKAERENIFNLFYECHNYMNYNIKHYVFLKNLHYIKDHLIDFCHRNFVASFPYKSIIENVKRTIGFINNKDRFLVVKDIYEKNIFGKKEVLLISAGPSLDSYIDLIKKYNDKFLIVCVDVILKKLEKNNINPDIVFSIDPSPRCADFLKTEDPKFLKDSIVILLSQQDDSVMDLLKERKVNYYISQFTTIDKNIGSLGSVPNVGTFSFHVIAHLGAKKLFTIGNDASFNQETGARYSMDSSHTQTEILTGGDILKDNISAEDILEVKGNLRKVVKTNRSLLNFRSDYNSIIDNLKDFVDYEAFNLSDGVYINGLKPMGKEEFIKYSETISKKDIDIKNTFDNLSKVLEMSCYEKDVKVITSIIQKTKKFKKTNITSTEEFFRNKIDLMIWILEKTKELSIAIFGQIFLDYIHFVDSYMNFAFNLEQKDIYEEKNINILKNYWVEGVVSVFKDMKDSVSK